MKATTAAVCVVVVLLCAVATIARANSRFGDVPRISSGWQPVTFGTSISQGHMTHEETVIWNHTVTSGAPVSCITYWWFTAGGGMDDTVIRFYFDDDKTPSIETTVAAFHGIAAGDIDADVPWGNALFGKGARTGGEFNTFRIPFGKSVRITLQLDPSRSSPQVYWFVVRGIEGLPVILSGIALPESARLRSYSNSNVSLQPLSYVSMAKTANSGAIYFVNMWATSGNLNFLEGCFRLITADTHPYRLLSSGTEDYFTSAFYFDGGPYHLPNSGLTQFATSGDSATVGAYRLHDRDPVFFVGGMNFEWRNGDTMDPSTGLKCTPTGSQVVGNPQVTLFNSLTLVYEW